MPSSATLSRRDMLTLSAAGVLGYSCSGWLEAVAQETAANPRRRRSCILLWMNGGPSQLDTFDPKAGHANAGPVRAIATSADGIRFSEYLPRLSRQAHHMALIRSMSTREGDHGQASYLMRTGFRPQGPIQYPTLGALLSKELGAEDAPLPNFVSIAPFRQFNPAAYSPGFLGPRFAPLIVGEANPFRQPNQQPDVAAQLRVQDIRAPEHVTNGQFDARVDILQEMERDFVRAHPTIAARSHQTAYDRAVRLMRTAARTAFNLDEESDRLRDSYGRNLFGQGCLLARRLVERGVPFIEVNLAAIPGVPQGWDTHAQNFDAVSRLCQVLDPAFAALIDDLRQRGLLETTTIVWMGEFGRTPRIEGGQGRNHFPNAWTTVVAGGGIRGGTVYGRTSADGMTVAEGRAINVPDLLATVCRALGVDFERQNMSNVGRPIPLTDRGATPIREILA